MPNKINFEIFLSGEFQELPEAYVAELRKKKNIKD